MQIDMKESQIPIQKVNPDTEICQASNASVRSLPDILGSQNEEKERTISQADNTDSLKFNQEVLVQRQKQVSFLGWIKQVLKLNNIYQISKSISLESSIQNERKPPNHKSLKEHLTIENDESSNLEDNQNKNLTPTEIVNNPQSQMCSFIKELFFFHIIKKIQKINKEIKLGNQTLKLRDLPPISENNKIESYIHKYQAPLTKNLEKKENINFYKLFFWQIDSHFTILMLILGIVESNSNFLISLLLNYLVEDFQENNLEQSYFLCFSLFIISMIGILSRHYQYTQLSKHGGKVKQIITNFLMGKLNEINHCSIQLAKSGSILNLISSDLSSLESQYGYIYCIPIVPISLIFSGWILWDKFQGAYGLIALLICILTYPTQTLIQKCIQQKMKHLKEHQDFRIKQQSNFFDNLQTIKMYCWQDQLQQRIFNTRCKEWKQYILIQLFTLIDRSINQSINIWGSFLFLVIIYNLNVTLTLQNVILTIQLMGSIRYYCVHQVSYGLKAIITLNVIFKRIQDFLNISPLFGKQILQNNQQQHQEDQQDNDIENNKVVSQFSLLRTSDYESQRTKLSLSMIEDEQIQIRQLNCFWDSNKPPILKNITFSAHRGQLICLIGKTGSGKTTFLQLLLKEVPFVQGMMDFSEDFTFGYVEQEPFISPTSIKDNILFGKQFDQELFNEVIKASNIQQDILAMPDLENTIIGDNGATLSGGQKVRLSLARALYSMPDIYLLDDPLSAVDSKVAKHIFTQAIKKFIFQYQTQKQNYLVPLVIMTTHQLQYAQKCDYIVVLEEGKIISQGKSTIIAAHIEKMLNVQPADLNETPTQQKPEKTQNLSLQMLKLKRKQSLEIDQLTNEDIKKTISQLMEYISVSRLVLLLFFNIITEVIRNLFYHYLTYFIDEEGINKYCAIIIVLVISNFFNNIIKYALCSHAILTTNNKIFSKTMTIIGKSKKENFENIPSSVILNKFSTDFSIVDSQMAFILIDIFEDGTQFFFSLLTLGYFQPYFFAPILISVFLSNKLLQNFSHVLSQLKLNDLAQRAPQLQFLKTNLKGLTHFRLTNYFKIQKKHINSLADNSFQSNFFYHQTQKCFSQCIDLIALFTKTSGMLLIIAFIKDSSLFSQALLLLQSFHSQNTLLRQLMELGGLLNSYQRLFQITEIETEQENTCKNVLPQAWPKLGNIKLKDLSLSYSKNQVPVLNQLNLEIKEREKVAFIGRTGAGKSSVINALFRLNEINEESQILIDGQNVKELSLCQLRKTFSIIPQQPFIFYGSIRENLDPEHSYSDRDIWSSLSEVRMDKYFEQQPAKLETNILELNLSSGQKQLICLARVILMRSKILILDEPSANIDMITDNQIQEIIREKFMHCTVITIAHRLNTISFYDKVIVLESGQIVEQGNPFELLCDDQEGNKIDKSSKFAEMIQETGQKNAQQFFQISKEYYKINQIKQKIKSII